MKIIRNTKGETQNDEIHEESEESSSESILHLDEQYTETINNTLYLNTAKRINQKMEQSQLETSNKGKNIPHKEEYMELDQTQKIGNELEQVYNNSSSSEGTSSSVEQYINNLADDVPDNWTIKSQQLNPYGGTSQIKTYNSNNSGAIVLESTNKMYQEMETRRLNDKEELQATMKNFMDQMTAQFANMTATLSASLQAGITENKNQIEVIRLQMANKAENIEVQQLANVIDKNTVKPMDLSAAVGEMKEEMHNNKLLTAKSSDLIPIEHEINEQGKIVDMSAREISALQNRLTTLQKEVKELTKKSKEDNIYSHNITKNINNQIAEKLQAVRTDTKRTIQDLHYKLISLYNIQEKDKEDFRNDFAKLQKTLEDNIILQTQLQERIKSLENEIMENPTNTIKVENNIAGLHQLYENILMRYEEISTLIKDKELTHCMSEIAKIKTKLNTINHLKIDNLQEEYKRLFHDNEKTHCLFEIDHDFDSMKIILHPKNEKCEKIINTLINERYLIKAGFEFPDQKISLSNISQFRPSNSFIGQSTFVVFRFTII
ncbi:hypothetical protein BCR36DRAFT_447168 [Piromyces finnis]|uniref:Uncharacterized protein n=1 Tax=Piromyces finnis TaxID=1754191 RepID=A0A1Y1VAD4_9FUNG|nr:hypothetical protein BCR36DRAFT_447168 [Piromyces finnis]|eukprot:ORX51126.1 hypothetical protein BCR36DRAFT_447168 [Piromyces finnis]